MMSDSCVSLCVLRAEGDGVEPALVIQVEKGKWVNRNHGTAVGPPQYIFGAPEGVSRLMLTHRKVLGTEGQILPSPALKAVFTSQLHPDQAGGILGLLLRLKADGHEKLHISGPTGLLQPLKYAAQNIVRWHHPSVYVTECGASSSLPSVNPRVVYSDAILSVMISFGLGNERWSDFDFDGAVAGQEQDESKFRRVEDLSLFCGEDRADASQSQPILAQCITLKQIRKVVLVLDLPSTSAVHTLLTSPFWGFVLDHESDILSVFHRSPWDVLNSSAYSQLLSSVTNAGVSHINMRSKSQREFAFTGSLSTLVKLNKVDQEIFRLPPAKDSSFCGIADQLVTMDGMCVSVKVNADGTSGECQRLDDASATVDTSDDVLLCLAKGDPESPQRGGSEAGSNQDAANKLKALLARNQMIEPNPAKRLKGPEETQITFLGTGCAEPSKYRGGSGILLEFPCGECMLLDAGEGVWGQMIRVFGRRKALEKLSLMLCVWVSHRHADHMLGVLSLLHNRRSSRVLLIIGPHILNNWLKSQMPSLRHLYLFKHHRHMENDANTMRRFLEPMGVVRLQSVPVFHCSDSYAIVLEHATGWKLSFSGDTRPCEKFIEASKASTLLIHEATFESKHEDHALRKRHCTISEALHVAKQSGAKSVLFTHFSQRYPHVPCELDDMLPEDLPLIAFDGMCVRISSDGYSCDNKLMPAIRSALKPSENSDQKQGQ